MFALVRVRLRLRRRLCVAWEPDGVPRIVVVEDPAFITGYQIFKEFLSMRLEEQRLADVNTHLFMGVGQLMRDPSRLNFSITEIVEMVSNGGIRAAEYRPQFSRGSFRIGFDSALQFVVVDGGWSSTALVILEARISCREAIEPAIDCPTGNCALTECIVDVSGRFACVVVLVSLVVDDCSKLVFTYHGR